MTLWSREYGYAGTADFIIEVDGKTFLADLKTGKWLHDEIGLQLSALRTEIALSDRTEEEPCRISTVSLVCICGPGRGNLWK